MEKRFNKNRLKKIGEGTETPVYSMTRVKDNKQRTIVLKTYESFDHDERPELVTDEKGFNSEMKKDLERRYKLLTSKLGPYIPKFRVIKNSDTNKDRFFAIQMKIDLPHDPDIFNFFPEDFEDDEFTTAEEHEMNERTKAQLLDLAARLKENFVQFQSSEPNDGIIIDLEGGENNIVIDRQGNLYYLDMGVNTKADQEGYNRTEYIKRIKMLERLAGKTDEELESDPFYSI